MRRGSKVRWVGLAILCVVSAACASGGAGSPSEPPPAIVLPEVTAFEGTTSGFTGQPISVYDSVLAVPRDRVWSVMPAVMQRLGVEPSTYDPRTFVIGNESWRASTIDGARLSSFLQCGAGISGPNADAYEVTMQLLVQLEGEGPESTLVRTVIDAYARPRYSRGATLQCSSQGTLERRVLQVILARLAEPEGMRPAVALRGPVPVVGDYIRLQCVAEGGGVTDHEGSFRGGANGALLLGSPAGELSVPAARVGVVQIRERRSRKGAGTVLGAALGIAGGAWLGRSLYDPEARDHYTPGVSTSVGAVLGGVAGALLGRLTGSFIERDVWVDTAPGWAVTYSPPGAATGLGGPSGCGGRA